ncbi:hypothetical protein [Burkholderia stagnalis]|uniref:Uncharacterized protein n=1 Tax=Burkholderia stagnalis TaxID=1503054 RepID=A0ABX9YRQ4_9BURK|nr:hypothetical protein [Burkholderia stagnalis]RQQ61935.1 hypothetical protein DF158_09905 [Burkholderia stagnalis]RQQ71852.1 hypothetical protein DF137_08220 [Burkholderia stagnalis]RQQ73044.1 hypothetical protein DF139_07320 [Burkholderia stagnalis]RQQ84639.1 hypothetical protein DF138_06750 [Burkholderia stagnalis]RQQ92381.1 hypothetical protein DF134_11215 [Burkholderia stagnalis]
MPTFASRLACLAVVAAATSAHAAAVEHAGRGVFHFASESGCPFAGNAATDCNRIALDARDVRANVDTRNHAIVFASDPNHHASEVLGDVLLQGSGVDADGQRVPLSVHVLLRRSGVKWNRDVYVHAPVRGKFADVRIDPYRIRVREGDGERDLLTPEDTRALFERPSFAARVARYFVNVRATDPKRASGDDITIALGVGSLSKSVARASFTSSEPGHAEIERALAAGTWAIRFDALSDHIPVWVAQRELFLFGLDQSPLVDAMRTRGFRKHDRIELGARNGSGYLRVNGREEPFAGAAAAGRAFLQESFIGLILAWHRAAAPAAPRDAGAARGEPA